MNISKGQSSQKQHLSNGSLTACNVKSSGFNKNDFESYKWWAENHIEACCTKCLNRFYEKQDRLSKKLK